MSAPIVAPAERMTGRARAYMAICAARHLILGLFCVIRPHDFTSGSFSGVKRALWFLPPDHSLIVWGILFLAVGLVAARAAQTAAEHLARLALIGSVIVTAAWVGGFIVSIGTGQSAGWSGVIVWSALAAKDLTMLRDPLRNPFEDLVRTSPSPGR